MFQKNSFSKEIDQIRKETKFNKNNIEKSLRIYEIINYIFIHSAYSKSFILKGGTALNLAYLNLKRLSVDIDLDYVGSLDRGVALKERNAFIIDLKKYMSMNGYNYLANKFRQNAIITTMYFSYITAYGGKDNIKIDINTIDRIHLAPLRVINVSYFMRDISFVTVSKEEIVAMKFCALIDRYQPRDLYDSLQALETLGGLDYNDVKKMTVFYLSLDSIFDITDKLFENISRIKNAELRKELVPVLNNSKQVFELSKENTVQKIKQLLVLTDQEKEYLKEFEKGNYNPSLLFDDESMIDNAKQHPMAGWIIKQKQKV